MRAKVPGALYLGNGEVHIAAKQNNASSCLLLMIIELISKRDQNAWEILKR